MHCDVGLFAPQCFTQASASSTSTSVIASDALVSKRSGRKRTDSIFSPLSSFNSYLVDAVEFVDHRLRYTQAFRDDHHRQFRVVDHQPDGAGLLIRGKGLAEAVSSKHQETFGNSRTRRVFGHSSMSPPLRSFSRIRHMLGDSEKFSNFASFIPMA